MRNLVVVLVLLTVGIVQVFVGALQRRSFARLAACGDADVEWHVEPGLTHVRVHFVCTTVNHERIDAVMVHTVIFVLDSMHNYCAVSVIVPGDGFCYGAVVRR